MALLLDRRGDQIRITKDVVKAAASNGGNGKEVMALLLDRRGDQIQITGDVVRAAASNGGNGKEVMALLLARRGDQIRIPSEAVTLICRSFDSEIVKLLLARRGDQIQITSEGLIMICAKFDLEIVKLLLDRHSDQIQITEDVFKAAEINWINVKGKKEVMALLFDKMTKPISYDSQVLPSSKGNSPREEKSGIIHHKTDDGDGLAIVVSMSAPAQSSYIGLAATCKEFCFLSTLRFHTSLLLLIIV